MTWIDIDLFNVLIFKVLVGLYVIINGNFMEVFGNYEKVKQGKDYTISRCVK